MPIITDTDGILDLCHCGGHAGWEKDGEGHLRARCTECPEQTEWMENRAFIVMEEWNKIISAIKQKERVATFAKQCRILAGLPNDNQEAQP